jgi:hypothetical protein
MIATVSDMLRLLYVNAQMLHRLRIPRVASPKP